MVKTRKKKPALLCPEDFDEPSTIGWHTLANNGWQLLKPTADLQVPLSPQTRDLHFCEGTINNWHYTFALANGEGTQTNHQTGIERQVKWFGPERQVDSSTCGATSSTVHRTDRDWDLMAEELHNERELRRHAELQVESLRSQLRTLHERHADVMGTDPLLAICDGGENLIERRGL